jgi:hypothetical protein
MTVQWPERDSAFLDYYRCPPDLAMIGTRSELSPEDGYFKFGNSVAFGRVAGGRPAEYATDSLMDVFPAATVVDGRPCLPFNLSEVATNLREERYRQNGYNVLQKTASSGAAPPLLSASAVHGGRSSEDSAEGSLERMGEDPVSSLAG